MKWYVYGLFDACLPQQIRYVGCTVRLKSRMVKHRCCCDPRTKTWAWNVDKSGSVVSVLVLEICADKTAAKNTERKWICNLAGLLNRQSNKKAVQTISPGHEARGVTKGKR